MEKDADRLKHLAEKLVLLFSPNDRGVAVLINKMVRLLDQIPKRHLLEDTLQMHELSAIIGILEEADRILQ